MADSAMWLPHIDDKRCTGCGDCIASCPTSALGWHGEKSALLRPEQCTYCTACEDVCPAGAIELPFLIVTSEQWEKIRNE